MRKRIGAFGLAAALLLTLICPALAANGKAEFVVTSPSSVKAGETFTVTVELKDNPGFNSLGFTLTYDQKQMTCTAADGGALLKSMLYVANPTAPDGAAVAAASVETVVGDGVMGTFTFTAKSDLNGPAFDLTELVFADEYGDPLPYETVNAMEQSGSGTGTGGQTTDPAPSDPGGQTTDPAPVPPGGQTDPTPVDPENPAPTDPTPTDPEVPGGQTDPVPASDISFIDTAGHWGEANIRRAAQLGLFKGYPDGSFGPNLDVTRGQYVTVLYRMAGSPAVSGETPFTDIAGQSREFQNAIAWAFEKGYVNGKTADTFDPAGNVTRQEAMKILFGYAGGVSGMEVMLYSAYDAAFTDSDELASWGKAPMYWGIYKSIISGTSETTLSPRSSATRAQLATILVRYVDQTANKT